MIAKTQFLSSTQISKFCVEQICYLYGIATTSSFGIKLRLIILFIILYLSLAIECQPARMKITLDHQVIQLVLPCVHTYCT